jgi:hypothetical protein
VAAFSEFFDHFSVEGWNVVQLATRNQSVINDDFLTDPASLSKATERNKMLDVAEKILSASLQMQQTLLQMGFRIFRFVS